MPIASPNEPYGYRFRSTRRALFKLAVVLMIIMAIYPFGVGTTVLILFLALAGLIAIIGGTLATIRAARVHGSPHWREARDLRLALDRAAWRADRSAALAALDQLRALARDNPAEVAVADELARGGAEIAQRFGPSLEGAQLDALLEDVERALERPAAARRIAQALAHVLVTVGDVVDGERRARATAAWQRLIACAPHAAVGGTPRWISGEPEQV
jgi:hypothetical protein